MKPAATMQAPQPQRHVKFGDLPKPARQSKPTDTSNTTNNALSLQIPACGAIAQRRTDTADGYRQQHRQEVFDLYYSRKYAREIPVVFEQVLWHKQPQPGSRVAVVVDEAVSPKTCALPSPRVEKVSVPGSWPKEK